MGHDSQFLPVLLQQLGRKFDHTTKKVKGHHSIIPDAAYQDSASELS